MIRYHSPTKRDRLKKQIRDRKMLLDASPDAEFTRDIARSHVTDAGVQQLSNLVNEDQNKLQSVTPPTLDELEDRGVQKDKVVKRHRQLREAIAEGMVTQREDHENPPGAVGKNIRWHQRVNHKNILPDGTEVAVTDARVQQSMMEEYRDLCRIIERTEDPAESDPDAANPAKIQASLPDSKGGDYFRKTFSPGERMTAQEWLDTFGSDGLAPVAKEVLEYEAQNKVETPSVEDQFQRLYGPSATEAEDDQKEG